MTDAKTSDIQHVEDMSREFSKMEKPVMGTARLLTEGEIVLIPRPSTDPCDPLNLPLWHKWTILVIVTLFSVGGVLLASSVGVIMQTLEAYYDYNPRVSDLSLYPTLFMGIGNVVAIPLAHAFGRRPFFLLSCLLMVATCAWAAWSPTLEQHIAARDVMSLAAGQSEALCPIIIQEIFFLHEHARSLTWFSGLQSIGVGVLMIASAYLTDSLGWRWWYIVFGIVNLVVLVLAFLFVVETKYPRSISVLAGDIDPSELLDPAISIPEKITKSTRLPLDYTNYSRRSFVHDLRPWQGHNNWRLAIEAWKQIAVVFWFPNVFWLMLCSGAFLGIYVLCTTVFAGILMPPPYSFSATSLGYVMGSQTFVGVIAIPILGYGNDLVVKYLSRRNGGIIEPEYRLLSGIIPFLSLIIATVMFGKAGSHPDQYSWAGIAVSMNVIFFAYVGMVVTSFTYVISSYPTRSDSLLVVLCACRGFISFGISFGVNSFVKEKGFEGAMNICAIIVGILAALGIPVYVFGKSIRRMTQRYAMD
ncbi:hypothetical protein FE257_013067 [Aspergillus nanangensis]|uniref:Major facilitator superfamily (MFS) profile domain-containing protein n=1 Tax=Aspergillus nanangensis TaxID=2582783 RepID=A0AAD4GPI1_ASPNN|nr:hypothetical protein FE257_013067 [Aspergillus nanangensis]